MTAATTQYQQIPTFPDAYYTEVVSLDGVNFLLTFALNQRENCYYLSIATPDGIDVVTGIKIVANWPLLHKYAYTGLPPGELTCAANTSTTDPAPGLGQIGPGLPFTLYYIPQALLT